MRGSGFPPLVILEFDAFDGELGRLGHDIDAILADWCAFLHVLVVGTYFD